jgi:hypothetical protein
MPSSHEAVLARIEDLYRMLFAHSGYGEMEVEIRFLRKHEKEVLIKCGKQYRFVVPCDCPSGETCPCHGTEANTKSGMEKQRGRGASAGSEGRKA